MTKLTAKRRTEIWLLMGKGIRPSDIARKLGIARQTIYANLKRRGRVRRRIPFSSLTQGQKKELDKLTAPGNRDSLRTIATKVGIPKTTAFRFIRYQLNRVRKLGDTRFLNADPEAQRIFTVTANSLGDYSFFVWGDEASIDHRDTTNSPIWAQRGPPVYRSVASGRGQVTRLICFSSSQGHEYMLAQENTFTKSQITNIIEEVVSRMNKWPNPRSILVLDNAAIHDADEINAICSERGILFLPLPKYSPHLNPEELLFHHIKEKARQVQSATTQQVIGWAEQFGFNPAAFPRCGYFRIPPQP